MSSFGMNITPQTTQTMQTIQMGTDLSNPGSVKELDSSSATDQTGGSHQENSNSFDNKSLKQALDKLNNGLNANGLKMEFDQNEPVDQIWLNLVDSTTGRVIQQFPPEGLRQFMETGQAKGFVVDTNL